MSRRAAVLAPNAGSLRSTPMEVERLAVSRATFDAVRLWVCVLIVFTIGRIHQHFSFLKPVHPALLVAGLALTAALINRKSLRTDHLWKTLPPKLIAGLAFMACVSAVLGISLGASAKFILFEYSKVLVLAFLLVLAIRNARDLLIFIWAYVIAAGMLSYLSVFVFRMSRPSSDGLVRILSGYTFDANDIGLVVLIGFALSLLTYQISGKHGRLVSAIIMVGIGITLAKTGSRGAFVGAIATALGSMLIVRGVSIPKRLAYVLVPAVALLIAAPAAYWDQMKTMLTPKQDYNWTSPTGRKQLLTEGLRYMWLYPIAGIGVENFGRAQGTISTRAQDWDPAQAGIKWSAPHNSFLQAAAEMGVPGIFLFSALVGSTIVIPITLRKRIPRHWAQGDPEQRFLHLATNYLPVAGIAFAVSGFFVSFAYVDPIYILGAFSAGLTTCIADRLAREKLPTAAAAEGLAAVRSAGAPVPAAAPEWRSRRLAGGLPHAR